MPQFRGDLRWVMHHGNTRAERELATDLAAAQAEAGVVGRRIHAMLAHLREIAEALTGNPDADPVEAARHVRARRTASSADRPTVTAATTAPDVSTASPAPATAVAPLHAVLAPLPAAEWGEMENALRRNAKRYVDRSGPSGAIMGGAGCLAIITEIDGLRQALVTVEAGSARACPCHHTTPCQPDCTCRHPLSSAGCARCCTYGSDDQRAQRAAHLAAIHQRNGGG